METFIKVYIKSEEDLPEKDGIYIVHKKENQVCDWAFSHSLKNVWLDYIDWYLKPVEIPEITDEEIQKYVNSFPDNPNHLLFDATINLTFVEGAKWYREELKKRMTK